MNTQEIVDEVRFITGYPTLVFDDTQVETAIDFTKNEMRSLMDKPDHTFSGHSAQRAIMWGTCYHLKIKTGEIGGLPISIGDVNLKNSARSYGEPNSDLLKWAEKFYDHFHQMDESPFGFGHIKTARKDREYKYKPTDYGDGI